MKLESINVNMEKDKENKPVDMDRAMRMWIHCNCCFVHFVDRENTLFLLACNHFICNKCVTAKLGRTPADAATYTCPICKRLVRARVVNNALPRNIKDLLHPSPWNDGLQHEQIDNFQKAHQKSLEQQIVRKEREVIKLDKDLELAQKIIRKHYFDHQQLRMERKQLEFQVQKVQRQAQLRKEEAKQRIIRQRTTSPNDRLAASRRTNDSMQQIKRKRSESVEPEKHQESNGITSFVHYNDHSFEL
ncbi:RING finger protein vilya [Drosophila nasuta]|uniref:RING finger protein vilya n=1 Tax=Drosophila nasuta TaxID=42062 RepID=UPI00295EB708|nr:RING finger protein vilya [Drosophila nasuta]